MAGTKHIGRRTSLLVGNILGSLFIKGWSAVVILLLVPVTLHCLGEYKNGVWLTISSLLLWIDNMDIGLGNGLRNRLAASIAHDDHEQARRLISSSFAMLSCIMIPILLALIALIYCGDTYSFLNVDKQAVNNLDTILTITVMFVCTTFVLKLTGNFYMGLQLPAVSNLLVCLGQTLALIGTYMVYLSGSHSLLHIALVNTASPLLVYLVAYPLTFSYKYKELRPSIHLVSMREAKSVMSMGIQFFIIQVSSVVLFMTSNLLISKFFSPSLVTPYQITYRYFSIMLVLFTVICMPFWNATTDAYERNDIGWIRQASKRLNIMTLLIFSGIVLMVVLSNYVYSIWIGDTPTIDMKMSIAMACYILTLIVSMRYSYFISGIGKLRIQLLFTTSAAILFIPLAYIVVHLTHDIIWFMATMSFVNLPGLIANRIQFEKLINGKASGIWQK